jgi:hypothetical protein
MTKSPEDDVPPPGFVRFSVWIQGRYDFDSWRYHFEIRGIETRVEHRHGYSALFRARVPDPKQQLQAADLEPFAWRKGDR